MYRPTAVEDSGGGATLPGARPSTEALRAASGVGIGYLPLLHRLLLRRRDAFDFVELPLDPYLDEAQRALLDPELLRLDALAAALACSWRGSALSLASADAYETRSIAAVSDLLVRTRARSFCEELAFRRVGGRDLGLPRTPPLTPALAELTGPRCDDLAARLPCALLIGLPATAMMAADAASAQAFLSRFASRTACGIVLEIDEATATGDPAPLAERLRGLPPGRVVQIALRSTRPVVWPFLDALLAVTGAGSVTIRRSRNLFPIDEILGSVERSREALAHHAAAREPSRRGESAPEPVPSAPGAFEDARAAMARDQIAFAERCLADDRGEAESDEVSAVRMRAVWRERVADIYRAEQLSRWAARPATWRV